MAELDTLVQTVRVMSENIGLEFGIQKCAVGGNEKRTNGRESG